MSDDQATHDETGDMAALRAEVAALAAERKELVARVDQLSERLDALATAEQVGRLTADLRAHLIDALGSLDGDAVMTELAGLRRQLGTDRGTVVEQLQDHLADVASGEVVGALWDEVRGVREAIDGLGADGSASGEVLDAVATLRAEVEGIAAGLAGSAEPTADPALTELAEELAVLRSELAQGLVVEPSDALSASLDALRVEVDALNSSLGDVRSEPGAAEPAAPAGVDLDVLADQVASLRDLVATEVDGLRQAVVAAAADRTDALVRSEAETPAADHGTGLDAAALEELKDEIRAAGAIGDQVIDALREELKALRRRIAVKASENVLDDDQLRQIADAVAARLEKG